MERLATLCGKNTECLLLYFAVCVVTIGL